jgi:hypothetical protein
MQTVTDTASSIADSASKAASGEFTSVNCNNEFLTPIYRCGQLHLRINRHQEIDSFRILPCSPVRPTRFNRIALNPESAKMSKVDNITTGSA